MTHHNLQQLLEKSAETHRHLCPRQVLGVRMGLLAGELLGLEVPRRDKRMFVFMETDGCGLSGVQAATGCTPNRRTLRVMDYGKMAATFVDTETMRAVRIAPSAGCRARSADYAPDAPSRWHCQLEAYRIMPDDLLFDVQEVELTVSMAAIISRPGRRVTCACCGEEIINEREVVRNGDVLCRCCAGDSYYITPGTAHVPSGQPSVALPVK